LARDDPVAGGGPMARWRLTICHNSSQNQNLSMIDYPHISLQLRPSALALALGSLKYVPPTSLGGIVRRSLQLQLQLQLRFRLFSTMRPLLFALEIHLPPVRSPDLFPALFQAAQISILLLWRKGPDEVCGSQVVWPGDVGGRLSVARRGSEKGYGVGTRDGEGYCSACAGCSGVGRERREGR
jgi:hypothetical protein